LAGRRAGAWRAIDSRVRVRACQFEDIARDLLSRVFGVDFDTCFISDDSSLWDFHGDEPNQHYFERIREDYGVDVSDIRDGNLARIFERLAADWPSKAQRQPRSGTEGSASSK